MKSFLSIFFLKEERWGWGGVWGGRREGNEGESREEIMSSDLNNLREDFCGL